MDRLWPLCGTQQPETVGEQELAGFYGYPESPSRPWLRVNFVSSLDGAVQLHGGSRALSAPADQRVLTLIRDLSDVVLVGAGTAVNDEYRGIRHTEARAARRRRLGLSPVPPLAVVTRRCVLPPDSPLFTNTAVPPLVLTCRSAPQRQRAEIADAGAEVILVGEEDVDLRSALAALDARGLRRIACEGGPMLFGALLAEGLVDELCLTLSPLLTSGHAGRIAAGRPLATPRKMRLVSVLHAEDSFLLLRYAAAREAPAGPPIE